MGLTFNGTEIETIFYNGVKLDKLIYNGVVVYEGIPSYTTVYINNTTGAEITGERLTIKKNNTNPTNIYLNNTLIQTLTTETNWGNTFTIPIGESVIKIEGATFYIDSSFLYKEIANLPTKVILGKNFVGKLGIAFNSSKNLKEIVCGPNVTKIQIRCSALEKITLSEGLQTILAECFEGSNLINIKIPASVTTIGSSAFAYSANLSNIEIESNSQLTSVSSSAFKATNITTLSIPGSNTQLGRYMCQECYNLTDLYIYSTATQTNQITSNSMSYVYLCNQSLKIHLRQSIGTMENARALFGKYFNYVSYNNKECSVVFDL